MALQKVFAKKDLPIGKSVSVAIDNKSIALFNVEGTIYAIGNECTHAGAPLCEGQLSANVVTCPWHGATFDVTNGNVLGAPAFDNVPSYKVVVEGDDIKLEL
jgi:nitrite reductase/ring-hydroxylating ferredoxin subunit